jgi:hypothetical protein
MRTLSSVSADELRRERIRAEQAETRISREIDLLEQQKQDWFSRGVAAASDRQKLFFARKVRETDQLVRARDQQLALVSRNLRVLAALAQLKDNQRVLQSAGMEGLPGRIDPAELGQFVEQVSVAGQLQMDRLHEILTSLDGADAVFSTGSDDADTLAVLDAMQQAASTSVRAAVSPETRSLETVAVSGAVA